MILSDASLRRLLDTRELVVDPLAPNGLQPGSIDCRLGNHFLLVDDLQTTVLKMDEEIIYREVHSDHVVLPPKTFLLATTLETIKLPPSLSAFVEGRSSIGRMGLFIQNAGWVDAGFEGKITLELYNANSLPIELTAGRRICQLVFCQMDQPAQARYSGKYFGQSKAVGSRIFLDLETHAASD